MITDGEKWRYTALKSIQTEDEFNRAIKSLSRLFKGITSNHKGDFYCLNCLHSFRAYNIFKKHEKLCENNDFCYVEMPIEKENILKYSGGMKSLRIPFVIYADLECLLVKQQSCQNNPDKSYTERKALHDPCGYSSDLICSFDLKENKHSFYRGKDCIRKFCKELIELGTKIINYEKKEMDPLTDREKKYHENQKTCYICQKRFCYNKKRGCCMAWHGICNLRYEVPHEIPVKFHNGSKYDYHFIIKELAEEFKGEDFECLAQNTEKYISF